MQDTFIHGKRRKTEQVFTVDEETGELIPTTAEFSEAILKDYHFKKIFLSNFWQGLSKITNRKTMVLFYVLLKCDKKNKINITYDEIIEKTGCSLQTVSKVFSTLKKENFLKYRNGQYMINPNVICECDSEKRKILLEEYNNF